MALRVAERFGGEIVNCDSLQLYRGFDIGTAKTPASERLGVPHHLFDVLEPIQGFSAGEYARSAREVVRQISARGHLPVVAGGTGFYLRALLHGLPALPERDEAIRGRLLQRERRRPGSIHRLLRRLEPAAAARIHEHDVQKLVRALEVRLLIRGPMPPQAEAEPLAGYRVLQIGLDPDRGELYALLDARTRKMFQTGLIEEVSRLLARGCTGVEKPFEALGYKQAVQHLRGCMPIDEAIESTQIETRQYAKRQLTWFRRDLEIVWLSGFGDMPSVIEQCFDLVVKFR